MKTRRKYGANSKDFNSQIAPVRPAANLPVSPNLHLDDASSDRQEVYTKTGAFVMVFIFLTRPSKSG
ncbi:MAG: hypothetical protein DMG41_11885 [Acidobacteria bacterium]|nr:MAG: hypothetical protein AUH13_11760 [Acidobacteria bacterium 13_2_20CM_58_27]PYT88434.1 MAG: hypothetical protein DMG41_11885 [Acidobacteriota bacterium]